MKHIAIAALALGLSGCADMSPTQQRTVTGGAIGAAGGGIIGALTGNTGLGLALGSAVGAGGGYLLGQSKESEQQAYAAGYQRARADMAQRRYGPR